MSSAGARSGAVVACAATLLLGAAGCGDSGSGGVGPLKWEGKPQVYVPKTLPNDRVMSARIRNDSLHRVDLTVKDIKLMDDDGKRVAASVTFLNGYIHGLYPPTRQPKRVPDSELLRTGRIARILPGKRSPITVSWRTRGGQATPTRLDYGSGSLPLPKG